MFSSLLFKKAYWKAFSSKIPCEKISRKSVKNDDDGNETTDNELDYEDEYSEPVDKTLKKAALEKAMWTKKRWQMNPRGTAGHSMYCSKLQASEGEILNEIG